MSNKIKRFVAILLVGLSVSGILSGCDIVDCYNATGMGSSCVYSAVTGK
jgi:hypothetical protein